MVINMFRHNGNRLRRKNKCCNGQGRCSATDAQRQGKTFLDKVEVGESGVVKTLKATPVIRKRLLAMGLTPGVNFKVIKVAPMGDPIEIRIRGYQLTMRKNEAACVEVE